jgi:hypothetical protein
MKNSVTIMILLLTMLSCHSIRHGQSTYNTDWVSWAIEFKKGTTKDEMLKAAAAIKDALTRDHPSATINFHTSTRESEIFILLEGKEGQAYSSPKTGGPKHPDLKAYIHLSPYVKNIYENYYKRYGT